MNTKFTQNIINQFRTLQNVCDQVAAGKYEFSRGRKAFEAWQKRVEDNKVEPDVGKAFAANIDLLREVDRELMPVFAFKNSR